MKFISCLVMAVAAMVTMSSCKIEKNVSNGEPKDYAVQVGKFNQIEVDVPCTVRFTQADNAGVKLRVEPNDREKISVTTDNGVLYVRPVKQRTRRGFLTFGDKGWDDDVEVIVSAPDLNKLLINSSGSFKAMNDLHLDGLDIRCAGSGEVDLKNVECNKSLQVSMDGAGELDMQNLRCKQGFSFVSHGSGEMTAKSISASAASFSIAGAGDVKSGMAHVGKTDVTIMGSGNVALSFNDCNQATISIMGSGNVALSGDLNTLSQHIAGAGNIDTSRLKLTGK